MDNEYKEGEISKGSFEVSSGSAEEIDEDAELESVKRVEAALFIAGRFLEIKELMALTDFSPVLIRKILGDLKDKYKDSGIDIVEQEGKWKMDVASEHKDIVNRLATGKSEFTKAEQETLAIIAYKQPMRQSVLVKIRGNKAYEHVKKFAEMNLINKKRIGHTSELTLNDNFHDYFHLRDSKNPLTHSDSVESEDLNKEKGLRG